jgi:parallel beta-helix repeat protein
MIVRECKLDGNSQCLIAAYCDDLSIEKIEAVGLETGIELEHVTNSSITENHVSSIFDPLTLASSSSNTLAGNQFISYFDGSNIRFSDDNIFRDNLFDGGLTFGYSYRNLVEGNVVQGGELIIPENLLWDPKHPEPRKNIVEGFRRDYIMNRKEEEIQIPQGSEDLFFFNLTRCAIPGNLMEDGRGVTIIECSDLTLTDWILDSCQKGFEIRRSLRVNVINNEMKMISEDPVIDIEESSYCRVEGNFINDTVYGIEFSNCIRPEIYSNTIKNIVNNGITIINNTREFLAIKNEVNGSMGNGILVDRASDGLISGNLLIGNRQYGVYLTRTSERNLVYNNRFIENQGSKDRYSSLTRQAYDIGVENSWYYEAPEVTLGNYWADLQGPDEDNDGIVDIEYYTDGFSGSYDLYPITLDHESEERIAGMRIGELWVTGILSGAILLMVLMVVIRLLIKK